MSKRKPIRYEEDKHGCWICISHIWKNKEGYPRIERDGKTTTMSRYMYEKYKRKIPNGLLDILVIILVALIQIT